MRSGVGLVGILVGVAVLIWILATSGAKYFQAVNQKGNTARFQAQQIAGVDDNGMRVDQTIVLTPNVQGKHVDGVFVTKIMPAGMMARHFGLVQGDRIIQAGPLRMRDLDDPEMAKALIIEAYQRSQELVVDRNGVEITLPNAAALPAGGTASGTTPPPPPPKAPPKNAWEAIQQIPMH